MVTANFVPAFVRNITDPENPIIRVGDTPEDYISIHGVEYLEDRPEEGEEADWQQLCEKYLCRGTEKTLVWLGLNHQNNSGDFPEAVAYRIEGDTTEYTKEEILSLINDWDASFSGYTFWDGHNWSFQTTSDELGEWFPVELELNKLASRSTGWNSTALYVGTGNGDTDYYTGVSHAGGERLSMADLDGLAEDHDWKEQVRELLYEAINTHLTNEQAAAENEVRNLYAERRTLPQLVALLAATGKETNEQELRDAFASAGTLL